MLYRKLTTAAVVACSSLLLLSSCGDSEKTSASGVKYQIHKDEKGENVKSGDLMSVKMRIYNGKDSLIDDGFSHPAPTSIVLGDGIFKGVIEEGFKNLSKGDSATIQVPADSIFKSDVQGQRPPFFPKGSYIKFLVKLVDVTPKAKFIQERVAYAEEQLQKVLTMPKVKAQLAKDSIEIAKYLTANKIVAKQLPSKIYIAVQTEGTGAQVKAGETATLHYTGTLLDGTVFDSSVKRGTPFKFAVGMGQVIPGWDIALQQVKVGTKAKIIIPSTLAYGENGAGEAIKPNQVLVFDIEVLDNK